MAFIEDFDDYDDSEACCCPRCGGVGSVSCHCGGDLCVCANYGDMDCPTCEARGEVTEKVYDAYMKREREIMAAFHGWNASPKSEGTEPAPPSPSVTSEPNKGVQS